MSGIGGVPEEFSLPDSLEIACDERSGRGIYCRQTIARGSEILTALPLGHVAIIGCNHCCHGCLSTTE